MTSKMKKKFSDKGYEFWAYEDEVRYCDFCGKPIVSGMTNDYGDFYIHEECFPKWMNEKEGVGYWKPTENGEDDGYGGFYLVKDNDGIWDGTGIYYTEWFDDYEEA